jgi:hypothetical protein
MIDQFASFGGGRMRRAGISFDSGPAGKRSFKLLQCGFQLGFGFGKARHGQSPRKE